MSPYDPNALVADRYSVVSEIARGGFGLVCAARDVESDGWVALKLQALLRCEDAVRSTIAREAEALKSVQSPHVVKILDHGQDGPQLFIAMELVDGPSLATLVDRYAAAGDTMPTLRALSILRQLCDGVIAIHGAGLVHRDLSTSNVVVEAHTGRPVIVDFGLALPIGPESRFPYEIVGTLEFMAPEQLAPERFGGIDPRTDLYALAGIAYEVLSGSPPFTGRSATELVTQHITRAPAPLSERRPELRHLDGPLLTALAKHPDHRRITVSELRDAFIAAMSAPHTRAGAAASERRERSQRRTTRIKPSRPPRLLRAWAVDDDPIALELSMAAVRAVLDDRVGEVRGLADGDSLLSAARVSRPDLLVLDYDMPGPDGLETLSRLRDMPAGYDTRVIVVSGRVPAAERWRFAALGVEDFVDKPMSLPLLASAIARVAGEAGWTAP